MVSAPRPPGGPSLLDSANTSNTWGKTHAASGLICTPTKRSVRLNLILWVTQLSCVARRRALMYILSPFWTCNSLRAWWHDVTHDVLVQNTGLEKTMEAPSCESPKHWFVVQLNTLMDKLIDLAGLQENNAQILQTKTWTLGGVHSPKLRLSAQHYMRNPVCLLPCVVGERHCLVMWLRLYILKYLTLRGAGASLNSMSVAGGGSLETIYESCETMYKSLWNYF